MKKIIRNLIIITFTFLGFTTPIFATGQIKIDSKIDLQPIYIPFFPALGQFNAKYATVFSWVTFIGSLITVGFIIFWIALVIRAVFEILRNEAKPEALEEGFKKIKSIIIGAALTLFFPVILSLVGIVLGIGSIFQWPKMFSGCPASSGKYDYYFQPYIKFGVQQADKLCGY